MDPGWEIYAPIICILVHLRCENKQRGCTQGFIKGEQIKYSSAMIVKSTYGTWNTGAQRDSAWEKCSNSNYV